MKFFSLFRGDFFKNYLQTFLIFPFGVFYIISLTILLLGESKGYHILPFGDNIENTTIVFYVFLLSIGTTLVGRSFGFSNKKNLFLQIFPIIFGGILYFSHSLDYSSLSGMTLYFILAVGLFSIIFIGLFTQDIFTKTLQEKKYLSYIFQITFSIFGSILVGILILILGEIALLAIDNLFSLHFPGYYYTNWIVISLSFFTLNYFLHSLPREKKEIFYSGVLSEIIIKYLLIPASIGYFIILYTYSFVSLIGNTLPSNLLSWMIIAFSIIGYITYIYSSYLKGKNKIITLFHKAFPIIVLPMLGMLFYAIYLRIAQYDLTTNRYLGVIFGIWLLLLSLYFIFSSKKRLIFIPVTSFIITLLISFGPWGVFEYPLSRQSQVLVSEAKTLGIITQNGEIQPLKSGNLSKEQNDLAFHVKSRISYICDYSKCQYLQDIFPDQYKKALEIPDENSSTSYYSIYRITNSLIKQLGLEDIYKQDIGGEKSPYFSLHNPDFYEKGTLDIEDFSKIIFLSKDENYTFDENNKTIILSENDESIYLGDFLNEILSTYNTNRYGELSEKYSQIHLKGEKFDYTLMLEYISFLFENDEIKNFHINGFLFQTKREID